MLATRRVPPILLPCSAVHRVAISRLNIASRRAAAAVNTRVHEAFEELAGKWPTVYWGHLMTRLPEDCHAASRRVSPFQLA